MSHPTRDFTATTFVVDEGKTLLILHRKIGKWFPPGGHIDPDELPCEAAIREVREETGLEIELLGQPSKLGEVDVLTQPECILLEPIDEGHQHIDLIYFARVVGGAVEVSEHEATDWRWCSPEDLDNPEIPVDIRELGLRAVQAVSSST